MKLIVTAAVLAVLCTGTAFSTSWEDCRALGSAFAKDSNQIHGMIDDYEAKLKTDPSDYYSGLAVGILYFTLAVPEKPESGAADKAAGYIERFLEKEKGDPLALIYSGLAHGLIARDSPNPVVKMIDGNKSFDICDRAVRSAQGKPFEWYIRFLRATDYCHVPDFFNKKETAEKDFRFVESEYDKNPSIEGVMGIVYFYLGEYEKSKGHVDKAVEYWKKSDALNEKFKADSFESRTAKKRLEVFAD